MHKSTPMQTIISNQIKVKGNISADDNIIINGVVIGNITTTNLLTVGQNGVIEGKISANNAIVHGSVKGNIVITNNLQLSSTANILGDIECGTLEISKGAYLQGNIAMSTTQEPITNESNS